MFPMLPKWEKKKRKKKKIEKREKPGEIWGNRRTIGKVHVIRAKIRYHLRNIRREVHHEYFVRTTRTMTKLADDNYLIFQAESACFVQQCSTS